MQAKNPPNGIWREHRERRESQLPPVRASPGLRPRKENPGPGGGGEASYVQVQRDQGCKEGERVAGKSQQPWKTPVLLRLAAVLAPPATLPELC